MTLPQYLLARADSNFILSRMRLFGLRPAVNVRWSAARALMLIALKTVLFAAVGFALSLLIYRQVVGWPMWWLGLFAFCHGIVNFGLTALCWNQRVERLRANPQLPTALPRSRFRPARWLLWLVYFLLLSLVTPLAMWTTVENVRGRLAWNHYKHDWEAKGEKFDTASLIPPPVPDNENFALTPLLRPIYDLTQGPNGVTWRDTNAYAHLGGIRVDLKLAGGTNKFPGLGSLEKRTPVELEALQVFYRGNTNYPQPTTSASAAQDILTALSKFDADLNELSEAAVKRPDSRFPIHYEDKPSWSILIPHLDHIKGLCQMFQLRAVARLELHQTNEAFADLKTDFRLSDSIRDEPLLIDHLVRIATLTIDLQVVREGLLRHSWSDAQLGELEKYLASVDLLAEYEHAMRGERWCNISGLEYLARSSSRTSRDIIGPQNSPLTSRLFITDGWLYQNMIGTARIHEQFLLPAIDLPQHRVFPEIADGFHRVLTNAPTTPYNIMTKMLMPALGGVSQRSARAQTFVDAALVACALEQYRLAHGQLPDTLDTLAPQFLRRIPNDVIDGKPLRYRKNSDGSYLLYSIGWNQTDDGGKVVLKKGGRIDIQQGDWVWQ